MVAMLVIQLTLSLVCDFKIWILKKIPIIGNRIRNREDLIENFQRRQAFNKHFPVTTKAMKRQTRTTNEIFKKFGRVSQKNSVLRRIQMRNQKNRVGDKRSSQAYRRGRISIGSRLMTVDTDSIDSWSDYA